MFPDTLENTAHTFVDGLAEFSEKCEVNVAIMYIMKAIYVADLSGYKELYSLELGYKNKGTVASIEVKDKRFLLSLGIPQLTQECHKCLKVPLLLLHYIVDFPA